MTTTASILTASHRFAIPNAWLKRRISIAVIGAGGTGAHICQELAKTLRALNGLSHDADPVFRNIDVYDHKCVTLPNLARTPFLAQDVGFNKAEVLCHRLNGVLGNAMFHAFPNKFDATTRQARQYDLIITATDNRESRLAIANMQHSDALWIDTGIDKYTATVVMGQINDDKKILPNTYDLFPSLAEVDDSAQATPSCSVAQSLAAQPMGINALTALLCVNMISQLYTLGEITQSGAIIDLKRFVVSPILISEESYGSFGYTLANTTH